MSFLSVQSVCRCSHCPLSLNLHTNKKVLLRERKRHTARRVAVASACYPGGGGYPIPGRGGYLILGPGEGGGVYPIPGPGDTLSQVWGGGVPSQVWGGEQGTLSHVRVGVPHPRSWGGTPSHGVPPRSDLGWGTPPPGQTWDRVPPPASVD